MKFSNSHGYTKEMHKLAKNTLSLSVSAVFMSDLVQMKQIISLDTL
jgi:hypothetical protein